MYLLFCSCGQLQNSSLLVVSSAVVAALSALHQLNLGFRWLVFTVRHGKMLQRKKREEEELNNGLTSGPIIGNLWDALEADDRTPEVRAYRAQLTHVGRLAGNLAWYGFFIRDLRYKTHSRVMDLLAERLLRQGTGAPPADPCQDIRASNQARQHEAWAAFAMGQ